jgi:hypothetical protein
MPHEISPPNDPNFMKKVIEERRGAKGLPKHMTDLMQSIFAQFEYEPKKIKDVSEYLLNSNVDDALNDSVSLYMFFSMCANKAKEREEYYSNVLKTLEAPKSDQGKVSVQRGGVRRTGLYRRTYDVCRLQAHIRRNCEDMAKAMEKRIDSAQTKSKNARVGLTGPWQDRET